MSDDLYDFLTSPEQQRRIEELLAADRKGTLQYDPPIPLAFDTPIWEVVEMRGPHWNKVVLRSEEEAERLLHALWEAEMLRRQSEDCRPDKDYRSYRIEYVPTRRLAIGGDVG